MAKDLSDECGLEPKVTGLQCAEKFRKLKNKHVATKDHNNENGFSPKTCPFFEQLDDIFHDSAVIEPRGLCRNLQRRKQKQKVALEDEDQDSVDIREDHDEVEPPAKKVNTKDKGERKAKSSIMSSFKEYTA